MGKDHGLRELFRDAPRLASERNISELLDINRKFHMAIVAVLDNPFITEMADKIYDQLARPWKSDIPGRPNRPCSGTWKISAPKSLPTREPGSAGNT